VGSVKLEKPKPKPKKKKTSVVLFVNENKRCQTKEWARQRRGRPWLTGAKPTPVGMSVKESTKKNFYV